MRFRSIVMLAAAGAALAQSPQTPEQNASSPLVRSTSQEVVLDMIVRDKKGHVVRDLKPEEIEVTDNGTKQKITSFRLVEGVAGSGKNAESTTSGRPMDPLRQVRLVTIAFERLGQDTSRALARQAALDLLKNEAGPNLYFGVFTIDQRLSVLQQYTSDKELIQKAIQKATSGTYSLYADESDRIAKELQAASLAGAAGPEPAGNNGPPDTTAIVASRMAEMTLNMLQFSSAMDRTQTGRASIFSLLALIKGQARLPGRKTLLYFTEGLYVPDNLTEQFHSMIGVANRANVSVYAVDAKGLVTYGQNSGASAMLASAAASSRSQALAPPGSAVRPDQAKALDLARDATRGNLQNSLAELSESTGGFLIANSNDLRVPLRQVSEDINRYYEAAYSPQIEKYDGSFRKIAVRLSRPDVHIQTRSGYYALPVIEGQTLLPFEMPMLSALTTTPLPKAIPFHSAAMHFQRHGERVTTAILADVPLEGITFSKDEPAKLYHTHLSVLALIKDAKGEIVQKLSQDVPFQGPLDKLEAFQRGHFIWTQHVALNPGRYTLETAVLDRENMRVGAKKAALVIAPASNGVGISSIAMIRRLEQRTSGSDPEDPFAFQGGKVTPNLAGPVPGGPGSRVSLYFVIYPQAGAAEAPQLTLDFLQDGKPIARSTPKLPEPDAKGQIPYIATSSIESLKPGLYEMRAIVRQGASAAQETALVTIE